MTNSFALLGLPRRPWLDPGEVQQAFITAARDSHPDRMHEADLRTRQAAQAHYTRLNDARQRLSTDHLRLRHLLELERGRPIPDLQAISGEVMDLFSRVGQVCRDADTFLAERAQTTSPLLKVPLFERGERIRSALESARHQVQTGVEALQGRLRSADEGWEHGAIGTTREETLRELEELFRLFSFHERWLGQLQARWIQLIA